MQRTGDLPSGLPQTRPSILIERTTPDQYCGTRRDGPNRPLRISSPAPIALQRALHAEVNSLIRCSALESAGSDSRSTTLKPDRNRETGADCGRFRPCRTSPPAFSPELKVGRHQWQPPSRSSAVSNCSMIEAEGISMGQNICQSLSNDNRIPILPPSIAMMGSTTAST